MMSKNALEGLRVLDLTQVWAGPTCTKILGDLGAEIIKIESGRRMDISRGGTTANSGAGLYPDGDPGDEPWNTSGLYTDRNRSKISACLDLTHPKGVEVLKKLVEKSDVVIESFRSGVMERFGLSYEDLKLIRKDIIMVSLASQGGSGPERSYGSFGATLEQTAGIASFTGYLGGDPRTSGTFLPDPMVAFLAIGIVLSAIEQRRTTGKGTFVDLSQREVTTGVVGEMVMDYTMNGRKWGPNGNRDNVFAPQGVYKCYGDDSWIAISVRTDDEWNTFSEMLNLSSEQVNTFSTVSQRFAQHDELDRLITQWSQDKDAHEVMHALQMVGIPAGVSLTGEQILADEHLNDREFWEEVDHPMVGRRPFLSRPFKFSKHPASTRSHAPLLGAHTDYVLRDIAGLSDEEITELSDLGITSNDPTAFGSTAF